MLSLTLLLCTLPQLLVGNNTSRSRKLVAIRDNRRRCRLLEDVSTHLLEEAALASLVNGLQDVMSRPGLVEVSYRSHRHVDTSVLTSQHTPS
jgi:hypothetical protein